MLSALVFQVHVPPAVYMECFISWLHEMLHLMPSDYMKCLVSSPTQCNASGEGGRRPAADPPHGGGAPADEGDLRRPHRLAGTSSAPHTHLSIGFCALPSLTCVLCGAVGAGGRGGGPGQQAQPELRPGGGGLRVGARRLLPRHHAGRCLLTTGHPSRLHPSHYRLVVIPSIAGVYE